MLELLLSHTHCGMLGMWDGWCRSKARVQPETAHWCWAHFSSRTLVILRFPPVPFVLAAHGCGPGGAQLRHLRVLATPD